MERKLLAFNLLVFMIVMSCARAPSNKTQYVSEIKKEITYTFDIPPSKVEKNGLNIVVSKAELMDETYVVNDCAVFEKSEGPFVPGMTSFLLGMSGIAISASSLTSSSIENQTSNQNAKTIKKSYLPENMIAFKVSIKSEVNRVLDLKKATFLLNDPIGNTYTAESISIDSNWSKVNWCATSMQTKQYLERMNHVHALQSALISPRGTYVGYLVFTPYQKNISGEWKLSILDFPISRKSSDHFSTKIIIKKWEATLKKINSNKDYEKIDTNKVL